MKKQKVPPTYDLLPVSKPYHAENKRTGERGLDRDDINTAMEDGRKMGVGAQVLSAEGTLLSRWVNAVPQKVRQKEDWYDGSEGLPVGEPRRVRSARGRKPRAGGQPHRDPADIE